MQVQGVSIIQARVIDHPPVVTTNLQQYYDIGNGSSYSGSGTTVTDLAAGGYGTGTLANTPTYTSAGVNGIQSYMSFDAASSEYFYTPNLNSMVTGTLNVTLEAWVRTASDNGVVVDEQGTTPFNSGWHDSQIEIVSGNLKATVWPYTAVLPTSGTVAVTRNVWQQYVLTYDTTTTTQKLYLNGSLVPNGTGVKTRSWGGTVLYYAIALADFTNLGDGSYLTCDWSIFRVYNRALTAAEILQNYRADSWRYS